MWISQEGGLSVPKHLVSQSGSIGRKTREPAGPGSRSHTDAGACPARAWSHQAGAGALRAHRSLEASTAPPTMKRHASASSALGRARLARMSSSVDSSGVA